MKLVGILLGKETGLPARPPQRDAAANQEHAQSRDERRDAQNTATKVPFMAPIKAPKTEGPMTTGTITGKSIAHVTKHVLWG